MIIFESGGTKNLILVILVTLFAGVIIWQWVASEPFAKVKTNDIFLTQLKNETGDSMDAFAEIKESVSEQQEVFKNIGEEVAKQAKQAQLVEEAKKYLEEKENTNIKSPSTQIDCESQLGQWNTENLQCLLATTDAGLECKNSNECQGYCTADLAEASEQIILNGQAIAMNGTCSENIFAYGCLAIVEDGFVNQIVCID
ncbi:MAG: hypothetical protein WCS88_02105 [Patescibacteria group bacterium]|jgi:hypothetical protein